VTEGIAGLLEKSEAVEDLIRKSTFSTGCVRIQNWIDSITDCVSSSSSEEVISITWIGLVIYSDIFLCSLIYLLCKLLLHKILFYCCEYSLQSFLR